MSQPSNKKRFVTGAADAPAAVARGWGTSGGVVQVRGPNGTWAGYELALCNLRTASCKVVDCPKAAQEPSVCSLTGLEDGCPYSVQVGWRHPAGKLPLAPALVAPCMRERATTDTRCRTLPEHRNGPSPTHVHRWWLCGLVR